MSAERESKNRRSEAEEREKTVQTSSTTRMCRWFAYIGEEPALLEDILIKPKHSLVKQIDAHFLPNLRTTYDAHLGRKMYSSGVASDEHGPNHFTNVDGFGVGFYTGDSAQFNDSIDKPCVYRSTRPPINDLNLASLCAHTATKCVFAHIRAGTSMSPIVETNNHPFVFGRYMFMHNGVVAYFSKIKVKLLGKLSAKAYTNIFGTTDTEHVAALFFTHLGDDWESDVSIEQLKQAMTKTLQDILALVDEVKPDDEEIPLHSSLNFAVTDNCRLLATRFSSMDRFEPPSLYYSTTAGSTLNRKFPDHPDGRDTRRASICNSTDHGKHVIVASEPNTYKAEEWHLVPPNSFVLVDDDLSVTTEKIPL